MNVIGRLFRLLGGGLMLASIVAAIAAHRARAHRTLVAPDANEIDLTVAFEPTAFKSTATSFRGGSLRCYYGGGVIDLREAVLDEAGATLKVRALFGGAQILVPETWHVTTRVIGIGGIADGRPHIERAADAPKLSVEGFAIFGGFAVASEISEADARGLADAIARWTKGPKLPVLDPVAAAAA